VLTRTREQAKVRRRPENRVNRCRPRMTRRLLPLACALGAVVLSQGCVGPKGPPQRIVLVTVDTLRADHLGCYGYPRGVSPFLDDLAERSVVFDHAISSCSHTAPSHASIFTSLQPSQHRLLVNGERLDNRLLTIAEVLSDQGYHTAAFTPVLFLTGLEAGFDHFGVAERYEPASVVLERALEHLDSVGAETPAFLWIHLFDVHEWRAPKRLDRRSVRWVIENADPRRRELRSWLRKEHGLPQDLDDLGRSIVQTVNRYDGQLYSVDQALQSFYSELGERGFLDDSVWFITSDHGEGLGNHHHLGHGRFVYEEQIRVPLLVHSPQGRFASRRVKELVRLVDLAPTLAALAGSNMDGQAIPVAGHSLANLLRGRRDGWQVTEAFAQRRPVDQRRIDLGWIPGDVYVARGVDQKLILSTEGPCELFDLSVDPFELQNICDPTDPAVAELLRLLTEGFELMQSQGEDVESGTASPEVIEELKALGYL
jgi:arylsulfatase A-like enzyme